MQDTGQGLVVISSWQLAKLQSGERVFFTSLFLTIFVQ